MTEPVQRKISTIMRKLSVIKRSTSVLLNLNHASFDNLGQAGKNSVKRKSSALDFLTYAVNTPSVILLGTSDSGKSTLSHCLFTTTTDSDTVEMDAVRNRARIMQYLAWESSAFLQLMSFSSELSSELQSYNKFFINIHSKTLKTGMDDDFQAFVKQFLGFAATIKIFELNGTQTKNASVNAQKSKIRVLFHFKNTWQGMTGVELATWKPTSHDLIRCTLRTTEVVVRSATNQNHKIDFIHNGGRRADQRKWPAIIRKFRVNSKASAVQNSESIVVFALSIADMNEPTVENNKFTQLESAAQAIQDIIPAIMEAKRIKRLYLVFTKIDLIDKCLNDEICVEFLQGLGFPKEEKLVQSNLIAWLTSFCLKDHEAELKHMLVTRTFSCFDEEQYKDLANDIMNSLSS